jgi:ankyrin repeat protein
MLDDLAYEGKTEEVARILSTRHVGRSELADALAAAAFGRREDVVEILLDAGALPNVSPTKHWPALFCAIEQRAVNIVRALISRGADVNMRLDDGFTPLHLAVDIEGDAAWQSQKEATADLTAVLLASGADPDIADDRGRRPLDIARDYNHLEAISLLERNGTMRRR